MVSNSTPTILLPFLCPATVFPPSSHTPQFLSSFPDCGNLISIPQIKHPKQPQCQKHQPRLTTPSPRTMHSPHNQQILRSKAVCQHGLHTMREEVPKSFGTEGAN